MRFLHSNSDYFAFLDSLDGEFSQHPNLASMALAAEYPVLRAEEAKAIYCDWRSAKRMQPNAVTSKLKVTRTNQARQLG